MLIRFLGLSIDERFMTHRRRSTSAAGIVTAITALVLFEYRYFVNHIWSWDLLAVGLTFLVIKFALMTYFYMTD